MSLKELREEILRDFKKEFNNELGNIITYLRVDDFDRDAGEDISAFISSALDRQLSAFRQMVEEIFKKGEQVNGFQPFGYTDEEKEREIFFDGFNDGRNLLIIDLMHLLKKLNQDGK